MNDTRGDGKEDALAVAKETEVTPTKSSSSMCEDDITTRALRFLSTASPETLGGVAVGLAACTWLILGRVGLVMIGVVGGVVLHATFERQGSSAAMDEELRREKGLDIVKRILDLRDEKDKNAGEDDDEEKEDTSFEGFQPETQAALNGLVDAIVREYVRWWWSPLMPKDQSFPYASRQTLTRFILSISQHLSKKRPADTFLDFLTNSSSIVIVFLNELSSALSVSQGTNIPPAECVYTYLSGNPDSNLANILNERQQSKKFKMIAEDILQNFLEKPVYDCDPARSFLRETVSGLMLEMTLKTISRPEWINGWIVHLLEEGEPDLSQAIDAGMGTGNDVLHNPFNDFDGNMGNVTLAKPSKSQIEEKKETKRHQKRLSKAEEAMEEAMEEAKRLSQLIADEDAKKVETKFAESTIPNTSKRPIKSALLDGSAELSNTQMTLKDSERTRSPVRKQLETQSLETIKEPHFESSSIRETEKPILAPTASSQISTDYQSPPLSPHSSVSPSSTNGTSFTSFDQIVPQSLPVALQDSTPDRRRNTISLTLHNANIIIHDDSTGADKGRLKSRPKADYLIQIEPSSSQHPGWMIVRTYPDFETLHEVLRRIAQISGVTAFTEQHNNLPAWKEHTKASLRGELERYLRDACWFQPLAESEGMKRFLEKDQGQLMSGSKIGLGWPTPSAFESMGKGMLDALTSAPKGVAEGGKVIGTGITGVFSNIGNLGQKKSTSNVSNSVGTSNGISTHTAARASTSTLPRMDSMTSVITPRSGRPSEDSLRPTPIVQTQPAKMPSMERRPSYNSISDNEKEREPRMSTSARSSMSGRRSTAQSREPSRASSSSRKGTPISSPIQGTLGELKLPPPPSDMPDDYGSRVEESFVSHSLSSHSRTESVVPTGRSSTSTAPSQQSPGRPSMSIANRAAIISPAATVPARKPRKEATPLSESETRVAVELLFAVINELYTLSSAWNIRRTLLTAAKTFLLRPGNPSLTAIQSLIQESVIAANTSDSGIAAHLRKIRENTLPTEEELKAWPAEMTTEEKESLKAKARKLLVERGVPAALTGVMGQAATGEAMGRIFDCLQVEEVARGLMFGLLLQACRAVTH